MIGISILATLINENNVEPRFGKYIGGYIGFILLPILFYLQPKRLIFDNKEKLLKYLYTARHLWLLCVSAKNLGLASFR